MNTHHFNIAPLILWTIVAGCLLFPIPSFGGEAGPIVGAWQTRGESLLLLENGFFRIEWAPEYEWEDPRVSHGRYSYGSGRLDLDFFDGDRRTYQIRNLEANGFQMVSTDGTEWNYRSRGQARLSNDQEESLRAHLNRANLMGTAWKTTDTQTIFFLKPDYAIISDSEWGEDQLIDGRVVTTGQHLYLKDYALESVQHQWRIVRLDNERMELVDSKNSPVTWIRAPDAQLNSILLKVYETYIRMIHNINRQAAYGVGQALGDAVVIYKDE